MSLLKLPEAKVPGRPQAYVWEAPADTIETWAHFHPEAAARSSTIDVFEPIGEDFFGDGFSAKDMATALKPLAGKDVTVRLNSPGGDLFDGLTIFNLLSNHNGKVKVEVLGIAASAASVIAMAGDEIVMFAASQMMIHNAWGLVMGNRHDMRQAADLFERFDGQMASLYAARTGIDQKEIEVMLDAETWLNPEEAVEKGFATKATTKEATPSANAEDVNPVMAKRRIESALAKDGVSRKERSRIITEAFETAPPRDARSNQEAARDAGRTFTSAQIEELKSILKI